MFSCLLSRLPFCICIGHLDILIYFFKSRWNSHNIKLAIFIMTIQWHLVHFQCCAAIISSSKTFSSLQRKPHSHQAVLPHSPHPHSTSPGQPWNCFLSLWICLSWIFHINGIIQYVTFCIWFLSLSIMFLRFIHVGACIRTSLFYGQIIVRCLPQFVYPFFHWWRLLGCFLLLAIMISAFMTFGYMDLSTCFQLFQLYT